MREDLTSSAGVVRLLLAGFARLGLSAAQLCQEAGIDVGVLEDPDARVLHDQINTLWLAAEARHGDPHLGVKVALGIEPRAINVASYLLMSSRTVGEGVERVTRFQRLISQASRIFVEPQGSQVLIRFGFAGGDLQVSRHQVESTGLIYTRFLHWISGGSFRPDAVHFRHPRPPARFDYEAAFGAPCSFEQAADALVASRAALETPSVHANAEMNELHETVAHRRLARLGEAGIAPRIKALLLLRPEEGRPSIAQLAKQLAMSPRTLQRRLAQEGTTFEKVLEGMRRELAMGRLLHSDDSVGEVAYLTGFSEASAFIRQFKQWTGQTPADWRRAHRKTSTGGSP